MKNTIKLMILCLLIGSGCKKDRQDRKLEIEGMKAKYDVFIDQHEKETGDKSGIYTSHLANSRYTYMLNYDHDEEYTLKITSKEDSFFCKVMIDGKIVHQQSGKEHNVKID